MIGTLAEEPMTSFLGELFFKNLWSDSLWYVLRIPTWENPISSGSFMNSDTVMVTPLGLQNPTHQTVPQALVLTVNAFFADCPPIRNY